jgi:hypothetical protein
VDNLDTIDGKTRSMVTLLKNLGISGSVLLVTPEADQNVAKAAHNLKGIWTLPVNLLNANDLLSRQTLILTVEAAHQAEEIWAAQPNRGKRRSASAAGVAGAPVGGSLESDQEGPQPAPRRRRSSTAGREGES